mmetsp:Transcript_14331/g.38674  ORF Transcript_14331/g.38674 Transcript_14331/m.38674 type:complete len:374 (+) Transcript_14331:382-1503(+)
MHPVNDCGRSKARALGGRAGGAQGLGSGLVWPATEQAPALAEAVVHVGGKLVVSRLVDEGPHRDSFSEAMAQAFKLQRGNDARGELFAHRLVDEHTVGGHAGLPRVAHLRGDERARGDVEVRVCEDHKRGIASEFESQALHGGRTLGEELLAHACGAREGEKAHALVLAEGGAHFGRLGLGARDHLGQPRRRARLLEEFLQGQGGEGRALRRLHHGGAPRSEGGGHLARDHGVGEVPRRDGGHHADGLLHHQQASVPARRLQDLAIHSPRLLGVEAHKARAVGDLLARLDQRLARFHGHQLREVLLVVHHEVVPLVEHRRSLASRAPSPFGQQVSCAVDGRRGLRAPGVWHTSDRTCLWQGWVDDGMYVGAQG